MSITAWAEARGGDIRKKSKGGRTNPPPPPPPPVDVTDPPDNKATKADLIDWLAVHGVHIEQDYISNFTKDELWEMVGYVIDDDLDSANNMVDG